MPCRPDGPFPQRPPEFAKSRYDYEIGLNADGARCIYTNLDDAVIRYIADISEYLFPSNFVMALAWKLAGMLAGAMIKGDSGIQMALNCEKMFAYWIDRAISLDAAQHREFSDSVPDWIARR